jgi:hypothetical protein
VLTGSAEPVETTKHKGHVARAVDLLLQGGFEDRALRDAARLAVPRQAIP